VYKTNILVIHVLKNIIIRKDCIVKLEYQQVTFFKTLKFSREIRRAFLVQGGLYWSKL